MLLLFLETPTGSRILKLATIHGSRYVLIAGGSTINHRAQLFGEPANVDKQSHPTIEIGKAVFVDTDVTVTPPKRGMTIGLYTIIGPSLVVKSAHIGLRVLIEADCHLGAGLVINEGCILRKNTVIPDKMTIPSFTEVRGHPGVDWQCTPLAPGYKRAIELEAKLRQLIG